MDWSKVKSILIYMFVALNIVLFVNIIIASGSNRVSRAILSNTAAILEAKGAVLECKIPDNAGEAGVPEYKDSKADLSVIIKLLISDAVVEGGGDESSSAVPPVISPDGNAKVTFINGSGFLYESTGNEREAGRPLSPGDLEKAVRQLFKKAGIPVSDFITDFAGVYEGRNTSFIRLVKKYRTVLLFDARIEAEADEEGIVKLRFNDREIQRFTDLKPIIPAYQILLKYFAVEGAVIKGIDFGYKMYKIDPEAQGYDVPVWRIATDAGNARYFRAYSGEEMAEADVEADVEAGTDADAGADNGMKVNLSADADIDAYADAGTNAME